MNCPNCGAYNHAQNFRCIRCGHVLPPVDDADVEPTDPPDSGLSDEERYSSPTFDDETRWQDQTSGQSTDQWGRPTEPPPVSPPPPYSSSQWSTPGTGPAGYAGPPPSVPNYLWQSIVVTLCCCWPAGIPAIVFAARVNSLLAAGDISGAEEASNKARMWTLISLGAGIFAYIVIICLTFASGNLEA
jgi:hypothetical protein